MPPPCPNPPHSPYPTGPEIHTETTSETHKAQLSGREPEKSTLECRRKAGWLLSAVATSFRFVYNWSSQSAVTRPTSLTSPENLLEMKISCPIPDLLKQKT